MRSSYFQIRDLSVSLSGKQILSHVTCSVDEPGHMIAILGPNGSGKTTLLRAICGEIPADGQIFLDGTDLSALSSGQLAKLLSYVPQQSGISISMSVMDVVLMGFYSRLKLLSQPSSAMQNAARQALRRVGIEELSGRDYMTLSGGEKQLVILARTLVEDTDLLLFDEPDSSLDLGNKYRMLEMIAGLVHDRQNSGQTDSESKDSRLETPPGSFRRPSSPNRLVAAALNRNFAGKSAILCLHDPVLALTYCDTLLLLKDGRLIHTLHPAVDSIRDMERAFSEIYGNVRLIEIPDPEKVERKRLVLLPVL